jgi:hypothetical protein
MPFQAAPMLPRPWLKRRSDTNHASDNMQVVALLAYENSCTVTLSQNPSPPAPDGLFAICFMRKKNTSLSSKGCMMSRAFLSTWD